jgi:hypothetical protein
MRTAVLILLVCTATVALAQSSDLELLRQDLKAKKVALLTEALALDEKQSDVFWPLYREYDLALSKLTDRRVAAIKKYAENYNTLTGKMADELVKESFSVQSGRLDLMKKYHKKFSKAVDPLVAARWAQAESRILGLVDIQIASEIPLVKPGTQKQEPK